MSESPDTEYVPTTEEIRDYVEVGGEPQPWMPQDDELDAKRAAAFDRWLAAHDAEVAAKALEDAAKDFDGIYNVKPYPGDRLRARAAHIREMDE